MSGTTPTSLFRIINGFRYFGVGTKLTRDIYKFPNTYYIVTRVDLSTDQNHGKAWGRLVWRGVVKDKDERIPGPLKKQWSLVETPQYKKFKGTEQCVQNIIEEVRAVQVPYGKLAEQAGIVNNEQSA